MAVKHHSDGSVTVTPRDDLLRRQPRMKPRMHALEELQHQLAVATELAEELGDHGRIGIYKSMIALTDYLADQGIPRATLYPLHLVAAALVDAGRGVATPAFEAKKAPGRPRVSLTEYETRAQRAVVVECCIRQKKLDGARAYKVEGAELAASLLRNAGWGPVQTAQQLMQLREEITACSTSEPMRRVYEDLLDSALAQIRPLDWAKILLVHGWVNSVPKGTAEES